MLSVQRGVVAPGALGASPDRASRRGAACSGFRSGGDETAQLVWLDEGAERLVALADTLLGTVRALPRPTCDGE